MIRITFPDGNIKTFEQPPTGFDIAHSISEGFARNCVAVKKNGQIVDLSTRFDQDTAVHLITHGRDGAVQLGDGWLDASTLDARQTAASEGRGWGLGAMPFTYAPPSWAFFASSRSCSS